MSVSTLQVGVSLIELLIAILILGILSSVAAPAFTQWVQNSQIKNAAGSIQDGLQLARVESIRRNQIVQFELGGGSNWTVGCETENGNCPGEIQSRASSEGSSNVEVETNPPTTTVAFNGLGRVTPAATTTLNFDVSNPTGGACVAASGPMRCLRVEVAPGGLIRMCDPSLPSSDPKGC